MKVAVSRAPRCLWVAGAFADGDLRLTLWGFAVVVSYSGVLALHWLPGRGRRIELDHADVAAEHLVERFLGLAALAILAVATASPTMIVGIAAAGAVLVAVAITNTRA